MTLKSPFDYHVYVIELNGRQSVTLNGIQASNIFKSKLYNEHKLSKEYTICKIHIEGFQNNTGGSQCMALLPLFIAKHVLWW